MQESNMSVYMTEEEQVERIKSWWNKYGNLITIIFSLILFAISGHRYWTWHKNSISQQASVIYERMMVAYADSDYKQVQSNSQRLIDDYKNTVYADVAHLTMAKVAVSNQKYALARKSLDAIIAKSNSKIMVDIARVRIARLLIAEKDYDNAQAVISKVTNKSLQPMVVEIQGDIAFAQNDKQQARELYKKAVIEAEKSGSGSLFLDMKSKQMFTDKKLAVA